MHSFVGLSLTRRTAILATAAATLIAAAPRRRVPRVLFVCEKGTVKSPIGRELLISRAKERGIAIAVESRGIAPGDSASAETKAALLRDGIVTARRPLRALSRADFAWADVVVAFNPLPQPALARDLRDWTDTPSVNASYAEAMVVIARRIEALLDGFATPRGGTL